MITEPLYLEMASAVLVIDPEIPMDAEEIALSIQKHGFEGFIEQAGSRAAELAEIVELITRIDGSADEEKQDGD